MDNKKTNKIDFTIVILLSIFLIVIILGLTGFIRFSSPRINYLIVGTVLLFPSISLFRVFIKHRENKVSIVLLSILSVLTLGIFLIWLFTVTFWDSGIILKDVEHSFDLIKTVQIEKKDIKVYRTNGGVTTDWGIVVRKEIKILPGLYLINVIGDKYHAYDAEIIKSNGDIQVKYFDQAGQHII